MQWTASGEVVLMTILGGAGTLVGPVLGGMIIKGLGSLFSSYNENILNQFFSFLPEPVREVAVGVSALFVGEGWELTLGLMFMIIVIFVPGGILQGFTNIIKLFRRKKPDPTPAKSEA